MSTIPHWYWLVCFAGLGACVGSFLNVVVWRTPRGESLVHPPSACPGCGHGLAARDNIPFFGWIFLRGRCRYCKMSISPEYPAVEAYTGLLFAGMYALHYMTPLRPAFSAVGLAGSWPVFAAYLILAAALVAVTLVDTALAIIPLCIPNFVLGFALAVLPLSAGLGLWAPNASETLATEPFLFTVSSRTGLLAVGGAAAMLGLANLLLWLRVLPHSYEGENTDSPADSPDHVPAKPWTLRAVLKAALVAWFLAFVLAAATGLCTGRLATGIMAGIAAALPLGLAALAVLKAQSIPELPTNDVDMPPLNSPRKVVLREALFAAFPVVGAVMGVAFSDAWAFDAAALPAWVKVAAGVAAGYLVGAGMIWAVRIIGTLALDKEAMGLGDVHLLGGIGAVLGPVAAVAVFFMLSVFMALLGYLGLRLLGKFEAGKAGGKPQSSMAFPYGPYLALAALLVMGIGLAPPEQVAGGAVQRLLVFCGVDPNNNAGILSTLHALALQMAK